MSKFLHHDDDADDARAMKYLVVFFENSRAKNAKKIDTIQGIVLQSLFQAVSLDPMILRQNITW